MTRLVRWELTALNAAIQVKHTMKALVNWGSDLYKSIYFLMWMFWPQSKENIIKTTVCVEKKNRKQIKHFEFVQLGSHPFVAHGLWSHEGKTTTKAN